MTSADVRRTRSGRALTDEELDALAAEVEKADHDVEALKERRRGRPAMGSAPADVVPVRLAPEMRAAIEARAAAEDTATNEMGIMTFSDSAVDVTLSVSDEIAKHGERDE